MPALSYTKSRENDDRENLRNILVIKLGALGDFIQALGPMAAIRQHHPSARITLLTTAPFEDFARSCGYFDDIWIDDKPGWFDLIGWQNLRKRLNAGAFDRVYDLQNNDRTSFYFRLFRTNRRPQWIGTAKGASHRNNSPERTRGHAFDGHVQTLALAGIKKIEIDKLDWMQADISSLPLIRPFILLVPGSAPSRPEKRWPAQHYARLCNMLFAWGYQPVLLGTVSEGDVLSAIQAEAPEALNLCGQTAIVQIPALARAAAAAIGNDTGPMHLIAATSCPCVVLFSGHSDPVRHAPKGMNVKVMMQKRLEDLKPEAVLKEIKPRYQAQQKSEALH